MCLVCFQQTEFVALDFMIVFFLFTVIDLWAFMLHNVLMIWKCFLYYWLPLPLVASPPKEAVIQSFGVFFVVSSNKLLKICLKEKDKEMKIYFYVPEINSAFDELNIFSWE